MEKYFTGFIKNNDTRLGRIYRLVNTDPDLQNYSHVFRAAYDNYMVLNVPEGDIGKCYYDIIKYAENIRRNQDCVRKVSIVEISRILSLHNSFIADRSNHIKLKLKSNKLDVSKASSIYNFPVDNTCMAVFPNDNHTIYIMIKNKNGDSGK